METDTLGSGEDLLFVMGWGNRLDGTNERWFLDRLAEEYRVRAMQIPTNVSDFESEYLRPVRREYRDLEDPRVLSHSTGGTITAYLESPRSVFVSPWWAFHGEKVRGGLLDLVARIPLPVPVVPIDFEREEVGEHVTETQWADLPARVSPTFVREIRKAQANLPPIPAAAEVFCSLRDTVVGTQGIGEHVDPGQVTLYDGGHEPFSSEGRERHVETVLDLLDGV